MPARRPIVVLTVLLGCAAPAVAAPPLPQLPADGAVVPTLRPAFAWTAGTSGTPVDHYEVYAEVGGSTVRVAEAPAGVLTARATVDLPDDGAYRWFVRLVSASGGVANTPIADRTQVHVATTPSAPALAEVAAVPGEPGARGVSWAGDRVASRWTLLGDSGQVVRSGESPTAAGRAVLDGLGDGAYVVRVVQLNSAGVEGPPAARAFTVDATPPAAPAPVGSGAGGPFAWTGLEPGAIATWRVTAARGTVVAGPADTAGTRVAPGALAPGDYSFEVRQTDAAGNAGPWGTLAFRIPSGSATLTATSRPAWRRHADRLVPAAGARVPTGRPVLRWTRGPRGTTAYNLQVFRVTGDQRLRKVRSAYPAGTRFVLSRRAALAPGACYVWRVWPYRGDTYTDAPLAVSDFCVRSRQGAVR